MQIDQLESRIDQLEKDQPQIKLVINYVVKGVVAVVAIVGLAVLKLTVGI